MTIVRSVTSQKTRGDIFRLFSIFFVPNRVHSPSKVDIVFDNYANNQTFSFKQSKNVSRQADKGKRLHIRNKSQEKPQGNNFKDFFKNDLNKADLIRRFSGFMQREVPHLHLDFPLMIILEKEALEKSLTGVQNLSPCNRKESDNRNRYHCTWEDKLAVVIASDTDILILMVHVLASRIPDHDWFLRFMIRSIMLVQSRCQQCSSSAALMQ